jgi:hypothetical protein
MKTLLEFVGLVVAVSGALLVSVLALWPLWLSLALIKYLFF